MSEARQQSSTSYPILLYMVLSSDHVTPATGKTLTVTLSKNGGAFASASGAVSEIANGWYSLAGNATDRNTLGTLAIKATASSCDDVAKVIEIITSDPFAAGATAADVWTYATRTLTAPTPTYSPVHGYQQLRLIRGESYGTGAAKDLVTGVSTGGTWPTDLSLYTWTFVADPDASNTTGSSFSGTVTVVNATGSSRSVRITIAASATSASGVTAGKYTYAVHGYITATPTITATPETGTLILTENAAV